MPIDGGVEVHDGGCPVIRGEQSRDEHGQTVGGWGDQKEGLTGGIEVETGSQPL